MLCDVMMPVHDGIWLAQQVRHALAADGGHHGEQRRRSSAPTSACRGWAGRPARSDPSDGVTRQVVGATLK
jgi:hypothetical protein